MKDRAGMQAVFRSPLMIDFEAARTEAFEGLALTNTIEKVQTLVRSKLGVIISKELWKVTIEIPLDDKVRDFNLLLEIRSDFPLSLPKIQLSVNDYNSIKYIPHVDDKRNICLVDEENIKIDTERPVDIIRFCLHRASKIISDGVNNANPTDFREEIAAYWSNSYHTKDKVVNGYLAEGVELIPGKISMHYLSPAYNNINLFLGTGTVDAQKLVDFFRMRGHSIEEQDAFYLGIIDKLEPPFYFDNKNLVGFIKANFCSLWTQVKCFLNKDFRSKVFIFSLKVDNELIFFGFYLYPFKTILKGWRAKSLNTVKMMLTVQRTQPVTRVNLKLFSYERIRQRTDGLINHQNPFKFTIAGLGSIGSNLLFYLSTLEVSHVILVDPEILKLENINRHLLSFDDVGQNKVEALSKYLTYNNPFLHIEKYPKSIVDVIDENLTGINEMDMFFCAIGKDSIENYILQCLSEGKLKKPVMLFWVEPYLIGAHVLYINPSSTFKLKDLYTDGFYQYNILSKETYRDTEKKLLLQEAGCQGSYVPYGKESITRFFAAFVPELFSFIKDKPATNVALTYAGDFGIAAKNSLKISKIGKQLMPFQLVKHSI